MKKSLNISTKIWMSLSILVLGYLVSMVFGFVLGQYSESRLRTVSEYLIPAAKQSRLAFMAFGEQIQLYKNAVITGDESLVEYARSKAYKAREALQKITDMDGTDGHIKDEVEKILDQLDDFTASAHVVYVRMCSAFGDHDEYPAENIKTDLENKAFQLAEKTIYLQKKLKGFEEAFALKLKTELSSISRITLRERYLSMIIFFAVVFSALTLISVIIRRSITYPLMRIVNIAEDITAGEDEIEWLPETSDEIGILNDSLRVMTTKLRAAGKKYRSIFENAVEGIFQVLPDGLIVNANPTLARIMGYDSVEEFLSSDIKITKQIYVDPRNLEKLSSTLKKESQVSGFEAQIYRKDKTPIWVSISARSVQDIYGNVHYFEGSLVDITEHMEKEKAERKRKAAEAANKAKSEFLANMSHEIRTPMNAILGFSEILLNKTEDPQQKNYLKSIFSSGKALLSLINDILDLSKIEAGRMEIQLEPVGIIAILNEIEPVFLQKFQEKGVEFRLNINDKMPGELLLDEIRIRQVLINLIGNAIKFTSQGYVKVSVCPGEKTSEISDIPDKLKIVIEVEDTGIGISDDQQELIFENFHQQDGHKSRKYEGTGLGLAITKRLLEMMNGTISVQSEVGKGSLFRVTLSDVEIAKKSELATKSPNPDKIHVEFEPATILLVDDIDYNRDLVKGYLEDTDLTITDAESGEAALNLLETESPDLILMDLRMPGKNGYEVTEQIKSSDKSGHIPVIALTASAMKETQDKIHKHFDGYLRKPISEKDLISELTRFLPYKTGAKAEIRTETYKEAEETVSEELKERLPEMIKKLETSFIPRWEEINDMLMMDDVEKFAAELTDIAEEFKISSLIDYSNNLYDQAQSYDVDVVEKIVAKFPELLDNIRKMQN